MKHAVFIVTQLTLSAAWVPLLNAADAITPRRLIHVESSESQVEEGTGQQDPRWVIRHRTGLKVVSVESGTVADVVEHAPAPHGHRSRLLAVNADLFAYASPERRRLTLARVKDGSTVAEADCRDVLEQLLWPEFLYLANDGSHLFCLVGTGRERIVRIDAGLSVTHSQELKGKPGDVFDLFATAGAPGFVIAVASGGAGWFQVFDHELRLLSSQRLPEPGGVYAALNRQAGPLILLMSPNVARWQLVGRRDNEYRLLSSGTHRTSPREARIVAAAIAPDGKYVVTSAVGRRPAISVWNAANGALVNEVHVEGGIHRLPSDYTIVRLEFSESGRFLTAADAQNAYLLEFSQLIERSDGNQPTLPKL